MGFDGAKMHRRKGKSKRDKLIRALDVITPKIIKLRDGFQCQRCGNIPKPQGCHWAHIYGRRSFVLRWQLLNAIVLCNGCHSWGHSNPLAFKEWFYEKFPARGPYLDMLRRQNKGTIRTQELETLLISYKQKYAELSEERG
jgi:5-methylcytosine-specific restriction endonuclease McrA